MWTMATASAREQWYVFPAPLTASCGLSFDCRRTSLRYDSIRPITKVHSTYPMSRCESSVNCGRDCDSPRRSPRISFDVRRKFPGRRAADGLFSDAEVG